MKLGDKVVEDIESIPTGSVGLDSILGVGYLEVMIEIYGPESSGKTTLTIHNGSSKTRWNCYFIDVVILMDMLSLDVNIDDLLISQPDNGEQHEIADHLISSGAVDLVIVDSVFNSKSEIEGEMGDSKMGLHAD